MSRFDYCLNLRSAYRRRLRTPTLDDPIASSVVLLCSKPFCDLLLRVTKWKKREKRKIRILHGVSHRIRKGHESDKRQFSGQKTKTSETCTRALSISIRMKVKASLVHPLPPEITNSPPPSRFWPSSTCVRIWYISNSIPFTCTHSQPTPRYLPSIFSMGYIHTPHANRTFTYRREKRVVELCMNCVIKGHCDGMESTET